MTTTTERNPHMPDAADHARETQTMGDPLMTAKELAAFLRKPISTIYRWNMDGIGPPYMKVGTTLRYRREDVDRWLDQQYVRGWPVDAA